MASLALPGMSGFVAKFLVFFGLITNQKVLMTKVLITFVMPIGMILTPIYYLCYARCFTDTRYLMFQTLIFLILAPESYFFPIFLPVLGIGMYPDFVLSLSVERIEVILSNFFIDSFSESKNLII